MNRGSNEIAAIKMMAVYMPRVLDRGAGEVLDSEVYAPLLGFQSPAAVHTLYILLIKIDFPIPTYGRCV